MMKIKIKNFGPIKDGYLDNDGWIDIKKVSIFIGNQGSGKSTVSKLISTFQWIEKSLYRGDNTKEWFEKENRLKNTFLKFHNISSYLNHNSFISYKGDAYNISYSNSKFEIEILNESKYELPQIMYVPAERNFLAYVRKPKDLNLSGGSLKEFLGVYEESKNAVKQTINLPINRSSLEYSPQHDLLYVKGDGYKVRLDEASSGFQSIVPLYIVSRYLSDMILNGGKKQDNMTGKQKVDFQNELEIITDLDMTEEQKRIAISVLASKFIKSAFINIVEEPEQNLFPSSQKYILFNLLGVNNKQIGNKLILTTHSPYLLIYLTLCVEANKLKQKVKTEALKSKLNEIVPLESAIDGNDLVVYQLSETNGEIIKLKNYKGLPSDDNDLNNGLADANEDFSKLLDLEDLCQ